MNRYKQREQAFILIFQSLFGGQTPEDIIESFSEYGEDIGDYSKRVFLGVYEKADELDSIISDYSTTWKLSRISKVNLTVLRLAVYEIKYENDVPDSVAINEAVELAKKYSSKEDSAYINGVLGAYLRSKA